MKEGGSGEEKKVYGTFQGQYPPPQPSIGFPQPVPPPGVSASSTSPYYPPHHGYQAGYQSVPGYAVAEGRPVREHRLPCCGIGIGWLLFLLGFFLAAIPWYAGAIIILCARVDYREKPGYVACCIAAVLATIAAVFGVTKGVDAW
ncbi:60S ribosomal protein L18a-like protein [Thalictrum thalictroides]|uniref:60S ribosomal protein L18a-like protein n=1 Tax=Thalictrum thalictroides TaxID=46969 RepID=A0A7J6XAB7_THATH|nr:60S ribosomal protein L18a-like protein [Thalictrum thalictroides]